MSFLQVPWEQEFQRDPLELNAVISDKPVCISRGSSLPNSLSLSLSVYIVWNAIFIVHTVARSLGLPY